MALWHANSACQSLFDNISKEESLLQAVWHQTSWCEILSFQTKGQYVGKKMLVQIDKESTFVHKKVPNKISRHMSCTDERQPSTSPLMSPYDLKVFTMKSEAGFPEIEVIDRMWRMSENDQVQLLKTVANCSQIILQEVLKIVYIHQYFWRLGNEFENCLSCAPYFLNFSWEYWKNGSKLAKYTKDCLEIYLSIIHERNVRNTFL